MAWEDMSWAYVAGFFDGEGTIRAQERTDSRGYPQRVWQLCFYQSSREVLDEIQAFLAAEGIESQVYVHIEAGQRTGRYGTRNQNYTAYVLRVGRALNVYKTLMQMERHLRVKYEQALDTISRLEDLMELALDGQLGNSKANQTYAALKVVENG